MDIIEKAKELGNLIRESQEMLKLKKSEELLMQDEKGKGLLNDLYMIQEEMSNALSETNDKEIFENIKLKFAQKQKEIQAYDVTRTYLEAKSMVDGLMKKINDVIIFSITGEEPCSDSDCSSCGCGCGH
ncbi:MAG: YlbF family regulator [Bacillota bacterium]|nr:YlbF family regulator [Bacillota bacterium]